MAKNVLFISYDGMTDPLGQSQVIPYLAGLTNFGYTFTILSCDKKDKLAAHKEHVQEILAAYAIKWVSLPYHKNPPVLSSWYDFRMLRKTAAKLHAQEKFDLVHTRAGTPALVGYWLKKKLGIKFLNDIRGFWADERIDGGIWNIRNPVYKFVFKFFKKKSSAIVDTGVHELAKKLEDKVQSQPGLYLLDTAFRKRAAGQLAAVNKPYLLFIHGTNSNTEGAFGDLLDYRQFGLWSYITSTYGDNILTFDHKTFTQSPLENVLELLQLLPANTTVHLITHSRGGLVISAAAQHAPDHIKMLVYLAAFLLPTGQSIMDANARANISSNDEALTIADDGTFSIAREAMIAASRLDPQRRLTVVPGTLVGRPARSAAIRPTLRLSSPAPLALPHTTSSMTAGSSPGERFTVASITVAARSSGRTPDNAPPYRPNGVRTASNRYAAIALLMPSGGRGRGVRSLCEHRYVS
jgi:pimeloyl-ACP methyl ester carboxylesterase